MAFRSFSDLAIKLHYESDTDDLLESFYRPVLARSVIYKRAVGYFSDAVLKACASELANFVTENGKIYRLFAP